MLVGCQTIPIVWLAPLSGVKFGLPTDKERIWLLFVAHVAVSKPSAAHWAAAVAFWASV